MSDQNAHSAASVPAMHSHPAWSSSPRASHNASHSGTCFSNANAVVAQEARYDNGLSHQPSPTSHLTPSLSSTHSNHGSACPTRSSLSPPFELAQSTFDAKLATLQNSPGRSATPSGISTESTSPTQSCRQIRIKGTLLTVGEPLSLYSFQVAAPVIVTRVFCSRTVLHVGCPPRTRFQSNLGAKAKNILAMGLLFATILKERVGVHIWWCVGKKHG